MKSIVSLTCLQLLFVVSHAVAAPNYNAEYLPIPDWAYAGCNALSMNKHDRIVMRCYPTIYNSRLVWWNGANYTDIIEPEGFRFEPLRVDNSDFVYGNLIDSAWGTTIYPASWRASTGFRRLKPIFPTQRLASVSSNGITAYQGSTGYPCDPIGSGYVVESFVQRGTQGTYLMRPGECNFVGPYAVNNQGTVAGRSGNLQSLSSFVQATIASPTKAVNIGEMYFPLNESYATDINDSVQVLGTVSNYPSPGTFGFYYDGRRDVMYAFSYMDYPGFRRISNGGIAYEQFSNINKAVYYINTNEYFEDINVLKEEDGGIITGIVDVADNGNMLVQSIPPGQTPPSRPAILRKSNDIIASPVISGRRLKYEIIRPSAR